MRKSTATTDSNTCTCTAVWILQAQLGMYGISENCHSPCTFCMDLCNWKHPVRVTCWLYTSYSVGKQQIAHSKHLSWCSLYVNIFSGETHMDREQKDNRDKFLNKGTSWEQWRTYSSGDRCPYNPRSDPSSSNVLHYHSAVDGVDWKKPGESWMD